ncbi:MAG: hypothetical protein ABSB34_04210 [Candidatus Limnocylindrales bacterium]
MGVKVHLELADRIVEGYLDVPARRAAGRARRSALGWVVRAGGELPRRFAKR